MKVNRRIRRTAREMFRLCLVNGAVDAGRAREVAEYLAGSRRRGALAALVQFQRLVRLDHDRHTALVESATPLSDDERAGVRTRLARAYGDTVTASFRDNPALIGGMRIRVGSDVYDGSIRARLAALEASL